MRSLLVAAALCLVAVPAANASSMVHCNEAWKDASPQEQATTTYKTYMRSCLRKSGTGMVTPVATPPKGATAKCNDGSYSTSHTSSGRCSSHGGVATPL